MLNFYLKTRWKKIQNGSILVYTLLVIFIFSIISVSILGFATAQLRLLRSTAAREASFHVAEAGVNYYQWRLAHFSEDFADGTGAVGCNPCGPYVHDYIDKDTNKKIGEYSLRIFPPPVGSTMVAIESTGVTVDNPQIKRKVTARYGIPSLARYAFLTNSDVWVGATEAVNGEMHSNGGIRFDGSGNAPITSSRATYVCQTYHGCSPAGTRNGVWGSASAAVQAFWDFPIPNVDFSTITGDFAEIKADAQIEGIYLPPSSAQGYSIVFSTTTPASAVRIYRVNNLRSHATGWDINGLAHNEDLDYNSRTLLISTSTPANGLIYIEDRVWVEGALKGRVTVAAARLPYNPATAPDILIPNNIVYDKKDGTNSLGLIAQSDVLVTFFSPNNLEINAALIAQNGSVQRYNFSTSIKNNLILYGALSSFGVWTWSWVNGGGGFASGYQNTVTTYDTNLLYSPPPNFPVSAEGYRQISWTSD